MGTNEIGYEIVDQLGVITTNKYGWSRELNIVSWNDGPSKYDIREWDKDHQRMSRGITLTEEEMETIVRLHSEYKARQDK